MGIKTEITKFCKIPFPELIYNTNNPKKLIDINDINQLINQVHKHDSKNTLITDKDELINIQVGLKLVDSLKSISQKYNLTDSTGRSVFNIINNMNIITINDLLKKESHNNQYQKMLKEYRNHEYDNVLLFKNLRNNDYNICTFDTLYSLYYSVISLLNNYKINIMKIIFGFTIKQLNICFHKLFSFIKNYKLHKYSKNALYFMKNNHRNFIIGKRISNHLVVICSFKQ